MPRTPGIPTAPLARVARRFGSVVIGLLVAGAALELGARSFASEIREHALPRELVAADPDLGWRLAVSGQARHRSQYFDTEYTTNTLGYRDEARSIQISDSYRMLLYGDSQVFGWGLPAERRFSNVIDHSAARLEIWNLAVPGYGVDQQVLSYERDAAAWNADAIILFVSPFTQDRLHYDYLFGFNKPSFRVGGAGAIAGKPPRLPRHLLYSLPRWMHTPYFVDRLLARADYRWRADLVVPKEQTSDLLATVPGFATTIAAERNHKVFVVSTRRPDDDEPLSRLCEELEIHHLDLGLPVEQAGLFWGPYDAHWNAAANEQIAAHLGRQIEATTPASRLR